MNLQTDKQNAHITFSAGKFKNANAIVPMMNKDEFTIKCILFYDICTYQQPNILMSHAHTSQVWMGFNLQMISSLRVNGSMTSDCARHIKKSNKIKHQIVMIRVFRLFRIGQMNCTGHSSFSIHKQNNKWMLSHVIHGF